MGCMHMDKETKKRLLENGWRPKDIEKLDHALQNPDYTEAQWKRDMEQMIHAPQLKWIGAVLLIWLLVVILLRWL